MTDRTNIFADVETIGSLFDALWYNATEVERKAAKKSDEERPAFVQRAREIAISDAYDKHNALQ